jgi:hypothetical protein
VTELVQALLQQHRDTLDRLEQGEADDIFLDDVLALLDNLRLAGEAVTEPEERARLRALIRFWSGTVYDYTGSYPTVTLLPADIDEGDASTAAAHTTPPPLMWLLAGGASVAVIAAALVIIGLVTGSYAGDPGPSSAAEAAPRVRYVTAEEGLGGGRVSMAGGAAFCRGASDFAFHFSLTGYQSDTHLQWVLRREGVEVWARPAAPYGEQNESLTVRIGSGETSGLLPGQYDLSLLSSADVIWVESFRVLDVAPRALSFQVSDVPVLPDAGDTRRDFAPGVRVLYLFYTYEGLCSGTELSHELRRDGTTIQRIDQVWQGRPDGQAQVMFQVTAGDVMSPGAYQIVVAIDGAEQGRIDFTIVG